MIDHFLGYAVFITEFPKFAKLRRLSLLFFFPGFDCAIFPFTN